MNAVQRAESFAGVDWEETVTVPVTTLDALITRHGAPDFCKIDIEGSELAALEGLSTALPLLSFEYIPATEMTLACIQRLQTLGNYRYNWSVGKEQRLASDVWLNAKETTARLEQMGINERSGCRQTGNPPVILLRAVSAILGVYISALAVKSAVRTFVLPRSAYDGVANWVFRSIRWLFDLRVGRLTTYEARDHLMAYYAPVSLLSLLPIWLALVGIGHTFIFYALGISDWWLAFTLSGCLLLTLGFAQGTNFLHTLLAFEEATTG